MSYVHDILLDMDFDRAALAAAVEDIRTLFRRTELPVVGPSGRPGTLPVLEDDFIGFNGRNRGCTSQIHRLATKEGLVGASIKAGYDGK